MKNYRWTSKIARLFSLMALVVGVSACGAGGNITTLGGSLCVATDKFSQEPNLYTYPAGEKGAQSFQVTTSAKISSLWLYQTSTGITQMNVTLYSGGVTPETGTLIASSSKISGFGSSSLTWQEYPIASEPLLSLSTTYFLVFWSTGSSFSVGQSNGLDIMIGNLWDYISSSWTATTASDISIGVTWGC
jgi:hypothetical protein